MLKLFQAYLRRLPDVEVEAEDSAAWIHLHLHLLKPPQKWRGSEDGAQFIIYCTLNNNRVIHFFMLLMIRWEDLFISILQLTNHHPSPSVRTIKRRNTLRHSYSRNHFSPSKLFMYPSSFLFLHFILLGDQSRRIPSHQPFICPAATSSAAAL